MSPESSPPQLPTSPAELSASLDNEKRLRAILETAVEGIITIDELGIVESFNAAAVTIFGYQPDEVIGKNISMLMPEPYRHQHDGYLESYRRTHHAKIIGIGREVVGRRKDGSVFPMDLSVSEVRLAEKRLFTGFVRDVTLRKEAEEKLEQMARRLEEKNKELETIVYVASHDLRSPLVNIQGFSKELAQSCEVVKHALRHAEIDGRPTRALQDALHLDIPEALEFIQTSVAKMDALLSGFLRFSRLGRAALKEERLDMNRMLAELAQSMEFQIKTSGATLEIGQLPECMGDATQIGQVFANLLGNAVKYLDPHRPGLITVKGWVEEGASIYVVADNGIGIAPAHQAKIFEIFHRLNPSAGHGEGLGLTIAQRILERHDGKIWVNSQAGEGSEFFVSLPHPSSIPESHEQA